MAGFFDFIKKTPSDASDTGSAAQTPQPVQVSSQQQVVQQPTSYNGIGTPAGGQSYNGIGTPPAAPVPVEQVPPQVVSPSASQQPAVSPAPQAGTDTSAAPATTSTDSTATPADDSAQKPAEAPNQDAAPVDTPATDAATEEKKPEEAAKTEAEKAKEATTGEASPDETKAEETKTDDTKADDSAAGKRMDMDVMTHLTQRSNRVFLSANNKAKELKTTEIDTEHLLHGLLADPEIYKLLTSMKIQPQIIEQELEKVYKKPAADAAAPTAGEAAAANAAPSTPQVSPRVKRILDNSLVIARKLGYEFISPEHLLLATYEEGEGVGARVLEKLGLDKGELSKKILGKKAEEGTDDKKQAQKSALEQFTIDLTAKAAEGKLDPVVGRSQEIERVVHIMSRRLKNNPVLIGEPGVGKTAIVEGLAQKIVAKQVPETLLDKRILQLDLMAIVAGASHRGEFEQRMKNMVEEVENGKGSIILFIDEIHNIMGAGGGGEGSSDASNFLKPALSRGQIQLIGATTITEYKIIEKDAALERRFQSVLVPEPSEENAIKMLKALRNKFESFHRVKIGDEALEAAVKLSKRYMGDRFLPDKAVDLIDEAASAVRLPLISLPEEIKNIEERIAQLSQEKDESEKKGDKVRARILNSKLDDIQASLNEKKDEYNMKKGQTTTSVTLDIIKDVIAKRTGIPVSKISSTEKDKLAKLEDIMHERLIGQERAVESVSQAVRRGRAGLKANNRPIGSFVFLGPSGVGKTELAKTLADILFGQEEAMIRFDMTEYMEKHEVAKLLGPPPGYVGYEEGGKLTEAVRRRQYAVVLFDEVEKAHPDIFNILLQILDDGRLTDNKGRVISFKNTVVICTSNIGTKLIQEELMKGGKGEAEEPPALSTYTFSPRGREIMTIGTKYFERDATAASKPAEEQKPKDTKKEEKKDAKTDDKNAKPEQKEEQKTGNGWSQNMLFDYFAGQKIENPKPEDPNAAPAEEQEAADFPTIGYDTHAISPTGVEMITRDSLLYVRNSTTSKVWQTQTLIDYFDEGIVINALPDAPDEQLPTAKLKTHAFSSNEMEIVTYRDRFWRRKVGTNDWETGLLKDYFLEQDIKDGSFPGSHWDIHAFSPTGREVIITGETIWFREGTAKTWTQQSLHDYFGTDFPLEAELDEKEKIENESDSKKYGVIKDKVMAELLKFFRPELVNRFDEVIVFEPLKFIHMISIVKLQLKALTKLLEEQELGMLVTDAATKEIVRSGFDPVFGARPLRRAIQRLVENPISELIIEQKVKAGDMIYIDFDGDKFVFDVERTEIIEQKGEAKNFTPVNIPAFLDMFYAKDKAEILKALAEKWPEYAEQPTEDAAKAEASLEQNPEPKAESTSAEASAEKPQDDAAKSADAPTAEAKHEDQTNGKPNGVQTNGTPQTNGLAPQNGVVPPAQTPDAQQPPQNQQMPVANA
jgi:ATP-dependent Clp protease ATP-binding subunit ClpC